VERREPASGPQHLRRLGRSGDRVHPVPGGAGDDRVEVAARAVPGFERRHLDLDPAVPGELRHPRVWLDAEHPAAGRLELPGRGAGAAADVDHVGAGAGGDDPVHQSAGIRRPGAVVAFGVSAERLGYLPAAMDLRFGLARWRRRCRRHEATLTTTG
jgi:hypothetical protein